MRVSVKKYDKGYREDAFLYKAYLNDVYQKDCHTADTEQGIVIVFKRDKKGEFIVNYDDPDDPVILEEIKKGRVTLTRN